MWHKANIFLTTIAIVLFASVETVDSAKAIANGLTVEGGILSEQAYDHALEYGIKLVPVDKEHWSALVNSTNINDSVASDAHDGQRARREVDPPDPTDWCTTNRDPSQCTFGAWCHEINGKDIPNRAWVFYNDCELTGDLHPWAWDSWEDVYSGLPWVTVFHVRPMYRPSLKYAGREWNNYAKGWELYYPYGTDGQYYYRRYFDCSS